MRKFYLFVIAALMGSMTFTACTNEDNAQAGDDTPSTVKAKVGIIIYGNAGGDMDGLIENFFFNSVGPLLSDPSNVRVGVCYKYGRDEAHVIAKPGGGTIKIPHTFTGKYAKSGQVVMFELTSKTPLSSGSLGERYGTDWPDMKMYDESTLTEVIDHFKATMPAEKYIMLIYGHGGGWDSVNDYVREAPATGLTRASSRGVLYDEWTQEYIGADALDMYEFRRAVEKSQIPHFDGLFIHSCLMGNMESLSDIYSLADYTICSMHTLNSYLETMVSLVNQLQKDDDFVTASKAMLKECYEVSDKQYRVENGDMKLVDNKEFPKLLPICKKLSSRLQAVYPEKKAEIDNATKKDVYRIDDTSIFVDLQYYAEQMAKATGDAELKAIADELGAQMKKTIMANNCYYHCPKSKGVKPDFSFSVVALDKTAYQKEGGVNYTFQTAYEYTNFHKQTEWGNWLNTVESHPTLDNPMGGYTKPKE
jgi:hypothetical protein